MIYFFALFTEIYILFLLSRLMSKTLSKFMSVNLIALIFLPGVIIHELSHLFIAAILFVPAGNIEFIPKKIGNGVKLGSIEIAKTDPIRRSIIGFAPVFAGVSLIVGAVYLFSSGFLFLQSEKPYIYICAILVLTYLLFAVSNTMFSSKADMEGTIEILIALFIVFVGTYVLGFRPSLVYSNKIFTKEFIGVIQKSTVFLFAPIVIDVFILGVIKLFRSIRKNNY